MPLFSSIQTKTPQRNTDSAPVLNKEGISMNRLIALLLTFAMALALAGCSASATRPERGETSAGAETPELVRVQARYPETPKNAEGYWQVWEDNPVEETFLSAVNQFAAKTAAKLLREEEGCYSPLSLYYALALAAEGARGETAEQLCALLGTHQEDLSTQCSNLFRRLYNDSKDGTLLIANSLWMDDEVQGIPVTFREEYLKRAAEDYYASLFTVDFSDSAAGGQIGDWVEENTKGLLRFEPQVNDVQLMFLLNTIYYKSSWTEPFEKGNTTEDTFTLADGTEQQVQFMHQTDMDDYYKGENYAFGTLYLNHGAMHFYLPDEGVDVHSLLEDETLFTAPLEDPGDHFYEIHWSVPKFSCDSQWKPMEALRELGVNVPFRDGADFSAMTDVPAKISSIQQGTHIGVDEEGVEAAAYTAIGMETSGVMLDPERVEMNLNRPFLYTLTGESGEVLFVGICDRVEE